MFRPQGAASPARSRIPDLVQDTQLETSFVDNYIVHHHDDSDEENHARSVRRTEYWQWDRLLARGGCSEVWLQQCYQGKHTHEWRAVKVIQEVQGIDYMSELEAIAKFSQKRYSRCFVKLLGWYAQDNTLFITMEYFPRGTLQTYMTGNPPIPEPATREITYQVLEGLRYMHREGFAHRDIKPGNVLIKSQPPIGAWWVKISDFGISKRINSSREPLSTVKGTVPYMAPEILGQEPGASYQIDYQAADMWSLGEMVFRMLTKTPTFPSHGFLFRYMARPDLFPSKELALHRVSQEADSFIRSLMKPAPESRLRAGQTLEHPWIRPCRMSGPVPALPPQPVRNDSKPIVPVEPETDPWATVESSASRYAMPEERKLITPTTSERNPPSQRYTSSTRHPGDLLSPSDQPHSGASVQRHQRPPNQDSAPWGFVKKLFQKPEKRSSTPVASSRSAQERIVDGSGLSSGRLEELAQYNPSVQEHANGHQIESRPMKNFASENSDPSNRRPYSSGPISRSPYKVQSQPAHPVTPDSGVYSLSVPPRPPNKPGFEGSAGAQNGSSYAVISEETNPRTSINSQASTKVEIPSLGTTTIELPRNTVKPTGGKRLFRRQTSLWDFSFTHDNRQLAAVLREPVGSGDDDFSVMVHDVNYGDVARKIMAPEGEVRGLAFTHGLDSPKVALAIFSGGFAIYTMPYWRPWLMVQGPTVVALAFQPGKDDQVLAVAYTSAVKLYELEPQGKTTLIGHITNRPLLIPYNSSTPSIQQISFSSSGMRLGVLTQSWVIVLEQEESGHWMVCHRLSNSGSDIISFQLDEGGSHIACCYDSGAMKMIDVPKGSTLWEASVSGHVYAVSFSPDYDYLGLATSAGVVIVDNQGQELFELAAKIAKGAVIKFSPYGQQIAAASKSGFTVWNLSMS